MGLIKAFSGAVRSELADQWKEYISCDSMDNDTLLCRGVLKSGRSNFGTSNTKGTEGIITKGSIIAVNEGQAMIVAEDGKIIDFTCEAGAYTFDKTTEPSLFSGNFGESLKDTFKSIGKRFTFGGEVGKQQVVYYVNTKEILGNKFGSSQPMPYDDQYYGTVLYIRYFGTYSFRVSDPLKFYASIAGNVQSKYNLSQLMEQCNTEFYTALDTALSQLAMQGVKFSLLPAKQMELCKELNVALNQDWVQQRGMEIVKVGINKVTPDDKSRERIEQFDDATMLGGNQRAMQGRMVGAQAKAFENMGNNQNGASGMDMAGMAFGMGMMQNMMGGMGMAPNAQGTPQQPQGTPQQAPQQPSTQPAQDGWTCECGTVNTGKFCTECGRPKPTDKSFRCDKCGWEPVAGEKPPKFCPECGDPFTDDDVI